MSEFEQAVQFVLRNEGGLSENVNDAGGITNFGISLRFLREVPGDRLRRYGIFEPIDEHTIKNLTLDQAKLIYRGEFWDGNNFDQIFSQVLCNYIFDCAVAHGISPAVKIVQRAMWATAFERNFINDDGMMGSNTIGYINSFGDELLLALVAIRSEIYRTLTIVNAKNLANLDGWLNRCYRIG